MPTSPPHAPVPLEEYIMGPENERIYIERSYSGTRKDYINRLEHSGTLYIANIAESTREERLWLLFGLCGPVRRVIRGICADSLAPAEFAFIEYASPADAARARRFFRGFVLDGRPLAVDRDIGFSPGRQFERVLRKGLGRRKRTRRSQSSETE